MAPKSILYTLFTTLSLALAATVPAVDYDVIVVGGGPAGLSALSGLSRVRRKAALFDSHEYRNDPTRRMHDVIGNDGTPPAEFRAAAREQISEYSTATFIDRRITSVTPIVTTTSPQNGTYSTLFRAVDADGTAYTTRKIILGTGLVDVFPDTPGLQENFGHGVFWCPWCDGYEHRDQPFGILGTLPHIVSSVLEVSTLNSDIIAFVNGSYTPEAEAELVAAGYPDWKAQVEAFGVRIENRTIERIGRIQDASGSPTLQQDEAADREVDVFRVVFTDGASIVRNAFLTNFETAQRSTIPTDLGLAMKDGKIDTSINPGMRTSLGGVFAVGDCNSDGSTNVPHAMYSGKRAAVYVHVEMAREESSAAIAKRGDRRIMEREAERRMGDEMERLWKRITA